MPDTHTGSVHWVGVETGERDPRGGVLTATCARVPARAHLGPTQPQPVPTPRATPLCVGADRSLE